MFHSAVVKLTAWYLLILMSISLLFSLTLYNITTNELHDRINDLQSRIEAPDVSPYAPNHRLFVAYSNEQREETQHNILITLAYVNILILLSGGMLCYLLARRTLHDIEQSHDAQSRFTSDASHELRTPLAAMRTELEVALRDPKLSKDEMRELLQSNLEEVNRMTALSQTLLHLSRLDYASLDFETVNLSTVVSDVIQRYDKNLNRIKFDPPKGQLAIKSNLSSIDELFTILVDNALKYSPEKSKIITKLTRQGRNAVFTITNTGIGISKEDLPHIFERFFRAENYSRTDGGAGLGLALAKEIVAMHKGEMSVSSTKNKYTIFTVILPLAKS
jgi:signal transduction histidine kinase